MNMKIITQNEWQEIADKLFLIRKAYNSPKTTDDIERLAEIKAHIRAAMIVCEIIEKKWQTQDDIAQKLRE